MTTSQTNLPLEESRPIFTPADCPLYPNQQGAILVKDFSITASDGKSYIVPAGFWFNGGSIPPLFWQLTFTPFDMRVIDGFLFHDWCYCAHCCAKEVADKTLLDYIKHKDLTAKGVLVHRAIDMFGDRFWKIDNIDKLYMRRLSLKIYESGRNPRDYGLEPPF